jgi:hypothetical protein
MTPNVLYHQMLAEDRDAEEIDDAVDDLADRMNDDARDRELTDNQQ